MTLLTLLRSQRGDWCRVSNAYSSCSGKEAHFWHSKNENHDRQREDDLQRERKPPSHRVVVHEIQGEIDPKSNSDTTTDKDTLSNNMGTSMSALGDLRLPNRDCSGCTSCNTTSVGCFKTRMLLRRLTRPEPQNKTCHNELRKRKG